MLTELYKCKLSSYNHSSRTPSQQIFRTVIILALSISLEITLIKMAYLSKVYHHTKVRNTFRGMVLVPFPRRKHAMLSMTV